MENCTRLNELNLMFEVYASLIKRDISSSFNKLNLRTIDDFLNFISNRVRNDESINISVISKTSVTEFESKWRNKIGIDISITSIDQYQYDAFYNDSSRLLKKLILESQNDECIESFMQMEYIDIDL